MTYSADRRTLAAGPGMLNGCFTFTFTPRIPESSGPPGVPSSNSKRESTVVRLCRPETQPVGMYYTLRMEP